MSQTRKLPALLRSPSMVEPRTSRPPMVCCHLHMPKSYEEGTVRLPGLSFDGPRTAYWSNERSAASSVQTTEWECLNVEKGSAGVVSSGRFAHCSCGLCFAGSASEAQRRGAR